MKNNIKVPRTKKQNFISIHLMFFFAIFETLFFCPLIKVIKPSVNDKYSIIKLIPLVIKREYIVIGKWYIKLNEPELANISCIVLSLKNNALTIKSDAQKKKKRNDLIIWEL